MAKRAANTKAGFFNLFKEHNKPWMKGRVRRVNFWLDLALMGHDMAHIDIADTTSFVRDDYRTHGLHLYSLDKRRLTHVIAERIGGGYESSVSSTLVITPARASPFLA
jgi:hypothetical protein